MTRSVKCYRCGQPIELNYKNIRQTISCSHCHAKMTYDLRSIRKLKMVRYLFVLAVAAFLVAGFMQVQNMNSYTLLIVTCMCAIVISLWADKLCLYISYYLLKGEYVEYHPDDKRKMPVKKKRK